MEGNIISILQDMEETFGFIPEDAVNWMSKELSIPAARFFGTATFYGQFHLTKQGKHIIRVCRGTACHVKGSQKISDDIQREFAIGVGGTTKDELFTLEHVACVGACSVAPVTVIGKEVNGMVKSNSLLKKIKLLREVL
jgi:NADH:ubiquinone oxidoreductase subunit E